MYHGDIRLGDTIDIKFVTTAASTGAPTQLAGTPVISAYPGNSTTQLTAGITLTVDFDTVTGLNNVRVVASGANGYATATNYALVITTGTVGGTSAVGYVVGSFSIENRSALMPTTAARTLDVSAGGEAGVDWANVGSPTTVVGLTGTTIKTATDVETDTADIQSRLPAALVSGRIDASVGAMAANVMTAAAAAADLTTELQSGLATAAALATVDTVVDGIAAAIGTPSDFGSGTSTIAANLQDMADNGTAVFDRSTDSLQAIRDHIGDGSNLTEAGGTGDHLTALATQASVNTIDDFLDTEVAAIKAKTDSLTFTVAGQVDANVQSINDVTITGNGQVGTEFGV